MFVLYLDLCYLYYVGFLSWEIKYRVGLGFLKFLGIWYSFREVRKRFVRMFL